MSNHGYCKNCWWWNRTNNIEGHCIMQSFSKAAIVRTDENSYCPDYINREKYTKKHKETLEEFCIDTGLPFFMYYKLR